MAIDCDAFGFFNKVLPMNQTNWANHFRGLLPDCVVAGIGDELLVYTGTEGLGMKVRVLTGQAMINNHRAFINSAKELPISEADDEFDRIDTVVLRVLYGDVVDGAGTSKIELDILGGEPAGIPEPAALTQVTGGTYEMPLAYLRVQAGTETILPDDVTDARYIFDGSDRVGLDFINGENDPLTAGELVKLSNIDGEVKRANESSNNTIGVVTSGAPSRGHVKVQCGQGKLVDIKCSYNEIKVGDALIVDTANPGMAKRGGGWGVVGLAVQSKEADIIKNVRSLLTAYSYFPTQNTWYLPTNATDDDVLAVYQFINQKDEETALKPFAGNLDYILTKSSDIITWTTDGGFFFPAEQFVGLTCADLSAREDDVLTIVARYSDVDIVNYNTVGLVGFPGLPSTGGAAKGLMAKICSIYISEGHESSMISKNSGFYTSTAHYKSTASNQSAVIAVQYTDSKFFVDGSLTSTSELLTNGSYRVPGGSGYSPSGRRYLIGSSCTTAYGSAGIAQIGKSRIQAVAIYSTALTDSQIEEVSQTMSKL